MDADVLSNLFNVLYSKFILRDLVGKIVPGSVVLFSFAALVWSPAVIVRAVQRWRWPLIIVLAGVAWTTTLALQNLGEKLCVWAYFPQSYAAGCGDAESNKAFMDSTRRVEGFLRRAGDGQKAQYERFVVIKEACGNMFLAVLLSGPLLALSWMRAAGQGAVGRTTRQPLAWLIVVGWCGLLWGLYSMHWQHVERQWEFTRQVVPVSAGTPTPGATAP